MAIRKISAAAATAKKSQQSEFSNAKKRRPFTVFLIMDDESIRKQVVAALEAEKLEVRDYMTAMEFYRDDRDNVPGVLVTDLRLRGMSGHELQQKMAAEKFDLPFIHLAGPADAPAAIEAMKDGALEFVMKPVSTDKILAAVGRAYASWYDVDWDFVGDDFEDIVDSYRRLTDREVQVIEQIADGKSSREIGSSLGISTKTVEAHRARINDKMRADDLSHLVRMVFIHREEQTE